MEKEVAVARVSEWAGVEIVEIRRYEVTPPVYSLVLKDGREVYLGPAKAARSQVHVKTALAEAVMVWPQLYDSKSWEDVVEAILTGCVIISVPGGDEYSRLLGWLQEYLEQNPPIGEESESQWVNAIQGKKPIRKGLAVLVNATDMSEWLRDRRVQVQEKELALLLRRYGATPEGVSTSRKYGRIFRRYWNVAPLLKETDTIVIQEPPGKPQIDLEGIEIQELPDGTVIIS